MGRPAVGVRAGLDLLGFGGGYDMVVRVRTNGTYRTYGIQGRSWPDWIGSDGIWGGFTG